MSLDKEEINEMGLQNGGLLTHCMKPPKFNYLVYSNINLVLLSLVIISLNLRHEYTAHSNYNTVKKTL